MTKSKRFTIARTIAGVTVKQFAMSIGRTRQAVHHCLNGSLHSDFISKAIDEFIAKHKIDEAA